MDKLLLGLARQLQKMLPTTSRNHSLAHKARETPTLWATPSEPKVHPQWFACMRPHDSFVMMGVQRKRNDALFRDS